MKQTELQQKETTVVTDIICDSCGQSCRTNCGFEYMEMKAFWGYASKKDMEKWSAQICEKCVDEKFSFIKFKSEEISFQTYLGTDSLYEKRMEEGINNEGISNLKSDLPPSKELMDDAS